LSAANLLSGLANVAITIEFATRSLYNMATKSKPTDLNQADVVAFLEEYWRGDFDDEYEVSILSKKARAKGEIFQLRSLLRHRYPSHQITLPMILKALDLKPEWEMWAVKLQVIVGFYTCALSTSLTATFVPV